MSLIANQGPIVRINPLELSICDPDFYNDVYVTESRRRTNNYDVFCKGIDFEGIAIACENLMDTSDFLLGSHFLTEEHSLHRKRRKPLEPFFSRTGIQRLQPMLGDVALKFENRLKQLSGAGTIIRLDHALSAFSGDVISRICLGDISKNEFLDDPEFAPYWYAVQGPFVAASSMYTDQSKVRCDTRHCAVNPTLYWLS